MKATLLTAQEKEDFLYSHLPDFLSGSAEKSTQAQESGFLKSRALFNTEKFEVIVFTNGKLSAALSTQHDWVREIASPAQSANVNNVLATLKKQQTYSYDIGVSNYASGKVIVIAHLYDEKCAGHCIELHWKIAGSETVRVLEIIETRGNDATVAVHNRYDIAEQANLAVTRLFTGNGNPCYYFSQFVLQQASSVSCRDFLLEGKETRVENQIALQKPQAQANLAGIYLPKEQNTLEEHLLIRHEAPHTQSTQNFRGIAADQGKGIFTGQVVVSVGASASDARQLNKGLLLSRDAEIDARPILEILNDDVKCSHGNTIGNTDPEALFYLKSRGIREHEAKMLLLEAFVSEILTEIADHPYAAYIQGVVEKQLQFLTGKTHD